MLHKLKDETKKKVNCDQIFYNTFFFFNFFSFRYKFESTQSLYFPIKMSNSGGRRLKQWLMEQIQSGHYSGLQWEDDSRTLFRIPWKHAGKQDYNQEVDASIFKVWHNSCSELARSKRSNTDDLSLSFPHRPGLCSRANIRRATRPSLLPGRPDSAAP